MIGPSYPGPKTALFEYGNYRTIPSSDKRFLLAILQRFVASSLMTTSSYLAASITTLAYGMPRQENACMFCKVTHLVFIL